MRFAVCNEIYKDQPIPEAFDKIASNGYDGVEIAPWTLGASIDVLDDAHVAKGRRAAEGSGLSVAGIYWIFGTESPSHIIRPEARDATLDILVRAAQICGDLGGDVIVFGSPWQRRRNNVPHNEATDRAAALMGHNRFLDALADADVTFCFEPLSEDQTDFVNRATDALNLVDRIDHTNVGTMIDGYSLTWKEVEVDALIRACDSRLCHFHADDETKRGPGHGTLNLGQIARSLDAIGYGGWMSIEAHDHDADLESLSEGS